MINDVFWFLFELHRCFKIIFSYELLLLVCRLSTTHFIETFPGRHFPKYMYSAAVISTLQTHLPFFLDTHATHEHKYISFLLTFSSNPSSVFWSLEVWLCFQSHCTRRLHIHRMIPTLHMQLKILFSPVFFSIKNYWS